MNDDKFNESVGMNLKTCSPRLGDLERQVLNSGRGEWGVAAVAYTAFMYLKNIFTHDEFLYLFSDIDFLSDSFLSIYLCWISLIVEAMSFESESEALQMRAQSAQGP